MLLFALLVLFLDICCTSSIIIDENGYILYCPCMGRFGNQADHFLGSLAFARNLNRTLVLPPWVEYDYSKPRSIQVAFDKYFKVAPLNKFHRVMTMERFMTDIAPSIWPPGSRAVLCYSARPGGSSGSGSSCNAKDGNPFASFWDTFSIDFDESIFYSPLSYDPMLTTEWNKRFPASKHLVLAFTGAPAEFPVSEQNVDLQRYLEWSDYIDSLANNFLQPLHRPLLAIHLRNGVDWKNTCSHVAESRHLFASPQCLGYQFEHGRLTDQLCFPSEQTIIKQVKKAAKKLNAKTIFIATDSNSLATQIDKALSGKVKVVQRLPAEPHVDLCVMAKADHLISNCVSSFSAFAVRERRVHSKSVEFWAFPPSLPRTKNNEL